MDAIDAGSGNDIIRVTANGLGTNVIGGTGSDTLEFTATDGNDKLSVSRSAASQFSISTSAARNVTGTGIENVSLLAGTGSDSITIESLLNTGINRVNVDFGRQASQQGVSIRTINDHGTATTADDDTIEEPVYSYSPDRGRDTLLVRGDDGATSVDDIFTLTTNDFGTEINRQGAYTVVAASSLRGEGDGIVVDAGNGSDKINAAGVLENKAALTLIGGEGNDEIVGSPFDDVLNSGSGNDRVTGGQGRDTFLDAGGDDTLVEQQDADIGIFGNYLVIGKVVGDGKLTVITKTHYTANQVQLIAVTPGSAPFRLSFNNVQTGLIDPSAANATAQLRAALLALPEILDTATNGGPDGVTVSGSGTPEDPWRVVFVRIAAGIDGIPELTGPSESVSVATKTQLTINAVQLLSSNATAGAFTLTYKGQTSASIAWNATAATVQTSIRGLAGNSVSVLGSGTATSPWVVVFASTGDNFVVPELIADSSRMVGGGVFYKANVIDEQTEQQRLIAAEDPDYLALGAPVSFTLRDRGNAWNSSSIIESTLNPGNGATIFEHAILIGGSGNNVMVVNDVGGSITVGNSPFSVTAFTGTVSLDNRGNALGAEGGLNEYYIINLTGSNSARVTIDDSGGTAGYDELIVTGTNGADQFTLDAFGVGASRVGTITIGDRTKASADIVSHRGVERVRVNALAGADDVLSNDTVVYTVIDLGSGDDNVTIATVPLKPDTGNRTLEFPDGVPVVDTDNLTNGNSAPLTILGGDQNDRFEVNHNRAKLYLDGGNGNDRFLLKTFLVLRENAEDENEITNLTTLFGGGGENRYDYLQNAPVKINGGPGTDTIVLVGTPIGDTFIVTSTYIAGAGRIINFTNIEAIEVDGGGGPDNIYILSTSPAFETTVVGGSGDDTIHVGGQPPVLVFDPPAFEYQPPAFRIQLPPDVVYSPRVDNLGGLKIRVNLLNAVFGGATVQDIVASYLANYLNVLQNAARSAFPYVRFDANPANALRYNPAGITSQLIFGTFFIFDASIELTIPDLTFSYEVGALVPREQVVQPAKVTLDPPPFAFSATGIFDVSQIRGRLIVVGGDQFENAGDRLIVHNQKGLSAAGQILVRSGIPRLIEIGQDKDGNSVFQQDRDEAGKLIFDEYQTIAGIGLATGTSANGLPFYGIDAQGFESIELRLADGRDLNSPNPAINGNDEFTVIRTYSGVNNLPGQKLVIDGGAGHDRINLGQVGGLTLIYGGAGDDTVDARNRLTQTVSTTKTSGTFILSFGAQTTAPIVFNATAAQVQAALAALSNIPAGAVTVVDGAAPKTWVVTFGDLSAKMVGIPVLTSADSAVTIKAGSLAGIAGRIFFDGDAHTLESVQNVASSNPDFTELLRNAPLVYINTAPTTVNGVITAYAAAQQAPIVFDQGGKIAAYVVVLDKRGNIIEDPVQVVDGLGARLFYRDDGTNKTTDAEYPKVFLNDGVTQKLDGQNRPLYFSDSGAETVTRDRPPVLLFVPRVTTALVTRVIDLLTSTPGVDTLNIDHSVSAAGDTAILDTYLKAVDKIIGGRTQTHGGDKFNVDPTQATSLSIPLRTNTTVNDVRLQVEIDGVTSGLFAYPHGGLPADYGYNPATNKITINAAILKNIAGAATAGVVEVTYLNYFFTAAAQTYIGGEPVLDPFTGETVKFVGGELVLNLYTRQPVLDANGIALRHLAGDVVTHFYGEQVIHAAGELIRYLGGEATFDETGAPVTNPGNRESFKNTTLAATTTYDLSTDINTRDAISVSVITSAGRVALGAGEFSIDYLTNQVTVSRTFGGTVRVDIDIVSPFLHQAGQVAIHNRGEQVTESFSVSFGPVNLSQSLTLPQTGAPGNHTAFLADLTKNDIVSVQVTTAQSSFILPRGQFEFVNGVLSFPNIDTAYQVSGAALKVTLARSFAWSSGPAFTLTGFGALTPGRVIATITDGSNIFNVTPTASQISSGTVTLPANLATSPNASVRFTVIVEARHRAGDGIFYNGSELTQFGQPIVKKDGGQWVFSRNDDGTVKMYQPDTLTVGAPTGKSAAVANVSSLVNSITLSGAAAAGDTWSVTLNGQKYEIKVADNQSLSEVAAAIAAQLDSVQGYDATATGEVVTLAKREIFHARGEPVYTLSGGEFIPATYLGGEFAKYLGNEPYTYFGGEQALHLASDKVQVIDVEQRVSGSLLPAGAQFDFTRTERLEITLGDGANRITMKPGIGPVTAPIIAATTPAGTNGSSGGALLGAFSTFIGTTTFRTGAAIDTFDIRSAAGPTTIFAGGADDVLNLGSEAGRKGAVQSVLGDVNAIIAQINFNGEAGNDTVNVDDHHDPLAANAALTHTFLTDLFGQQGVFGAGGKLQYLTTETLNIILGTGNDALIVGSLADTVTPSLDSTQVGFPALVNLYGNNNGPNGDKLTVYAGGTVGLTGTLTRDTVTGLGMIQGIFYTEFEALNLSLSRGNDNLFIESTHAGSTVVDAGDETSTLNGTNDVINIGSTTGLTTLRGGDGNDRIRVNYTRDGLQTFLNGIGAPLTIEGGEGNDFYEIGLSGLGSELINVNDSPAGDANDVLRIYGTLAPDFFLFRPNTIVALETNAARMPVADGRAERVNYRGTFGGRISVFGRDGDDTFVLDDTAAPLTIYGDSGNDTFQVGQLYKSPRDASNPYNGLLPGDYFPTTLTTKGYLSNGISAPAELHGGTGRDSFTVYRNLAEIFLFGEEDDDTFRIRAFVKVDPKDPKRPFTNINGGQGADFIDYTVNAPVRVEGGDGFDTLTIVGTEFGDDFVVTREGVFGGGLFITYAGIEKLTVDALEGNDTFFIVSTPENVIVETIGGLGTDTFNSGGFPDRKPVVVVAKSLEGHSGLIDQSIFSIDGAYNAIFAQDLSVKVFDNGAAGVQIRLGDATHPAAPLRVFEKNPVGGDLVHDTYQIVLTHAPEESVRITASPTRSQSDDRTGAQGVLLNGSATGVTLVFDRTNWFIPQTITITAPDDSVAEGRRLYTILHTVIQGGSGADGGAYDNLPVLSATVEVVDDDAASVIIAPTGFDTVVAEGVNAQPAKDTYAIVLSRKPTGPVNVGLTTDGETRIFNDGTGALISTVIFDETNWNVPQIIRVVATPDDKKEGTHFSRITHTILGGAAELLNYFGLGSSDVVLGLTTAVQKDVSSLVTATADVVNGTITLSGPAFKMTTGDRTSIAASPAPVHALTSVRVTLSGALANGALWRLRLDGAIFDYLAKPGDTLDDVATGLKAAVGSAAYSITLTAGGILDVTRAAGAAFGISIAHFAPGTAVPDGVGGALSNAVESADYFVQVTLTLSGTATIADGGKWSVVINGTNYQYVAGKNGEERLVPVLDVRIADDDAPGLLITQSGNSTNVIESSDLVVLGEGLVSSVVTGRKYLAVTVASPNAKPGAYSISVSTAVGVLIGSASVTVTGNSTSLNSVAKQLTDALNAVLVGGTPALDVKYDITVDSGVYTAVFSIAAKSGADVLVSSTVPAEVTTKFVTRFAGDFGVAVLRESGVHDSIYNALNIDLARWSAASNADIVKRSDGKWDPHLSILATGDGSSDFYRFTITDAMLRAAGGPIVATFDIDHGYDVGDSIAWRSFLKIYDQDGRLVGQGAGGSNPLDLALSGTGSTTFNDDFLTYSFSQKGTYYVQVDNASGFGGLPVGVNYTLNVSIPQHAVSGFVFAPEPLSEAEDQNNSFLNAQNVNSADNFYTFFDPNIGNVISGGGVSSDTPYVRIQGSGNGSYDIYSFVVTDAAINPKSTDGISQTPDNSIYYKSVSFQIAGAIRTGDIWKLNGLRNQNYSYTVQANDTVEDVARELLAQLPSRFYQSSYTVTGTVTLVDEAGFTFGGLSQLLSRAGSVTRSTLPKDSAGTPITFSQATISLVNVLTTADAAAGITASTAVVGDVWTVNITDATTGVTTPFSHTVAASETLSEVAQALVTSIGSAFGATRTGTNINLTKVGGFRLALSVAGENTFGSLTVSGRPLVQYTAAIVTIGAGGNANAATGDVWTITVDGTPFSVTVSNATTSLDSVASSLLALIPAGYGATRNGLAISLVKASATTGFTLGTAVTSTVTQSAMTIGGTPFQPQFETTEWASADFIIADPVRVGDVWTLVLNGESFTYAVPAGQGASAVATNLRTAINNDPDDHFTASVTGTGSAANPYHLVIVPKDAASNPFTATFTVAGAGSAVVAANTPVSTIFTFSGTPQDGEIWRLVSGNGPTQLYTHTVVGNAETLSTVINALVTSINTTVDNYVARAEGTNQLVLTRIDGNALPTNLRGVINAPGSLTVNFTDRTPAANQQTKALQFTGAPHEGEVWRVTVGTLGARDYTVPSGGTLQSVVAAITADIDGQPNFTASARLVAGKWTIAFTKLSGPIGTVDVTILPATVTAPDSKSAVITLKRVPTLGETWTLTFTGGPNNVTHVVTAGASTAAQTLDELAESLRTKISGITTVTRNGAVLTLSDNNNFTVTASVTGTTTVAAVAAPYTAIVKLGGRANAGDTWAFDLPGGGAANAVGAVSVTVGTGGFGDILSGAIGDITAFVGGNYVASSEGADTLVISEFNTNFSSFDADSLTVTSPDSITRPGGTITTIGRDLNGAPNLGDVWTLSFAGVPYSTTVIAADTLTTIAKRLADAADAGSGANHAAVSEGEIMYLSTFGGATTDANDGKLTVASAAVHGGFIVEGKLKADQTQSLALDGANGVLTNDEWTIYIKNSAGVVTAYQFAATAGNFANVTAGLAGKLPVATYNAGTNATLDNVLDVSRDDGAPIRFGNANADFDSAAQSVRAYAFTGVLDLNGDGTPRSHYQPTATITLASDPASGGLRAGDVWRLTLDNQYYEYEVPSMLAAPRTLSTVAAGLVAAVRGAVSVKTVVGGNGLANEVQSVWLNATTGTFTLSFRESSAANAVVRTTTALTIGTADAAAVAAALNAITLTDGTQLSVAVTGGGTLQSPWQITFLTPGSFNVPVLTGAVTDGANNSRNPTYSVSYNAGAVSFTVSDRDVSQPDPFVLEVKRGGTVHVVLDIDKSSLVFGTDSIFGYTTSTVLELFNAAQFVAGQPDPAPLAVDYFGAPGHRDLTDPGSDNSRDAFLEYDITQPGTYFVRVSSRIDYDDYGAFGIPSSYYVTDYNFAGVIGGQSYELNISLQGHETNPQAIGLVGKTLTIVDGTGKGQTAQILGYDAEAKEYTLDRVWTSTPDDTSKFEISYHISEEFPGTYNNAPTTDSYSVSLTRNPGALVYLRAVPSLTRTYNSDLAFDSTKNNGRNEAVQVRVATQRSTIELRGPVTPGEVWTFQLTGADTTSPTHAAKQHETYSYIVQPGDTLLTVAAALQTKVDVTAHYIATRSGTTVTITSTTAPFFAEVLLSRGGADITRTYANGELTAADVKLIGSPTVRFPTPEVWRLTLNGEDLTYHVNVGDTLEDIAAGLMAAFVRDGFSALARFANFSVVVDAADATKLHVSFGGNPFTLAFSVTPDRNGAALTGARDVLGNFTNVNVALAGHPNGQGEAPEIWKLTLDANVVQYTARVGDTLAAVANGLLAEFNRLGLGTLYTIAVNGSQLDIARIGGAGLVASFIVTPTYETPSVVTPLVIFAPSSWAGNAGILTGTAAPTGAAADGQIYYDTVNQKSYLGAGTEWVLLANWNDAQEVFVEAVSDEIVDGSDALVFPSPEQRVNGIRGPLIINGGIGVAEDAFLNNPFRLPGETNFPLPDGRVYGPVVVGPLNRVADTFAIHTLPEYGERLGFDPRSNLFLYNVTLLDGGAADNSVDLFGTNRNILTVGFKNPFAASVTLSGNGAVVFTGIPDPTQVSTINWRSVQLSLSGVASRNEKWTVTLDGTDYVISSVTLAKSDVASLSGAITKLSGAPAQAGGGALDGPLTYLWSQFTAGEKATLLDAAATDTAKLQILLPKLNGIMNSGANLSSLADFQGVVLSPDTINLLALNPTGDALARLNRVLIDDALAGALSSDTSSLLEMVEKLRSVIPGDYTIDFYASVFGNRLNLTKGGAAFTFNFVPDALSTIAGSVRGTPVTLTPEVNWTQAAWVFSGDVRPGDTATVSFAGLTFTASAPTTGDPIAGLTAALRTAILGDIVGVPAGIAGVTAGTLGSAFQPGVTGDTLIFKRGSEIAAPFTAAVAGGLVLTATSARTNPALVEKAEITFTGTVIPASVSVTLNGHVYSYSTRTGDRAADVLAGLLEVLKGDTQFGGPSFQPTIEAGVLTLKAVQLGDSYFYAPVNLNTRVIESDQVDILNVFNADSPADDRGTLTENSVSGLGMGGATVVGGRAFDGGITYTNLEVVNVQLGSGNDRFTVESTHRGLTLISSNDGADIVDVKSILGHTIIQTGIGDDVINLHSDDLVVDQLNGQLVVDGGAGRDVLNLLDNTSIGILTTTAPGQLDVDSTRTIVVQAANGRYILRTTGFGLPLANSAGITRFAGYGEAALDFSMGGTQLQQALRTLFGTNNLTVSETRAGSTTTFAVSLTGTGAPQLAWTIVVQNAPVPVGNTGTLTATTITGLNMFTLAETQRFTVQAASGSYVLRIPAADTAANLPSSDTVVRSANFADVVLNFSMSAAEVAAALREAYGVPNIEVSLTATLVDKTYTVTFVRGFAGRDFAQITWLPGVLAPTDLSNVAILASELRGTPAAVNPLPTALVALLRARLPVATLAVVDDLTSTDAHLRSALLTGFNSIISSNTALFDAASFAGINLSPVTLTLISRNPLGSELADLSRALLADALTSYIAPTQLVASEDSSAFVVSSTVRDGTTVPGTGLGMQQVLNLNATAGTFTISFRLTADAVRAIQHGLEVKNVGVPVISATYVPTINGTTVTTGAIPIGATAAELRKFLDPILNPNNSDLALPHTDNVAVTAQAGGFVFTFQGEYTNYSIQPSDLSTGTLSLPPQTITIKATGGTFRIGLRLPGGVTYTQPIAFNASANDVLAALDPLLNSRNATTPLTDAPRSANVAVTKQGSVYVVMFQGQFSDLRIVPGDVDGDLLDYVVSGSNARGTATLATQLEGIHYSAFEELNIDLSAGSDIFNIRGTADGTVTNVRTHDGDDRLYISSQADRRPDNLAGYDYLNGTLDDIRGILNVDGGAGRQTLMISDEAAILGDANVAITDNFTGIGLPSAEILVSGLAPGLITFGADKVSGNFADGITLWSGFGNDTIAIDGTIRRAGLRTSTTLNTGLGNDDVTVTLTAGQDDFFVLNTQGAYNNQPLVSDDDTVNAGASTLPLIIFGGQGDDEITGGQGSDILFGDRGRVLFLDGSSVVAAVGHAGPGDFTDGTIRPATLVFTEDAAVGGSDTIHGREGRDLIFGGAGADTLYGFFSDNALADVQVDVLIGDDGIATFVAGVLVDVHTTDPAMGGGDTITAGIGANLIVGGAAGDIIHAGGDAAFDVVLGDNGRDHLRRGDRPRPSRRDDRSGDRRRGYDHRRRQRKHHPRRRCGRPHHDAESDRAQLRSRRQWRRHLRPHGPRDSVGDDRSGDWWRRQHHHWRRK